MATYEYLGRDAQGKLMKGRLNATTPEAVAEQLTSKGIIPTQIQEVREKKTGMPPELRKYFSGKVKTEELIIFSRQMYTLIKSGVPILSSLRHIAETARSPLLRQAIVEVMDDIAEGKTFSQALGKHPTVFPVIFISLIDAGENSGQLDSTFEQLINYLELESNTVKKIKAVSRYPILVIIAIVAALVVVNFMVVPAFAGMFAQFKTALPLPTRILMASSNFFINYWPYLLGAIVICMVTFKYYLKTKKGRYEWDRLKLKMPIVGPILNRVVLARFSRTLALMLKTSLPIIRGLTLSSNILNNRYISDKVLKMREGIERGESLTRTAIESELFSPLVIQMISVGEEAGSVDTLLSEIADYYEREVNYDLSRLGDLIEPVLLVIMGAMVLLLAMGVFLPMWNMVKFIKGG